MAIQANLSSGVQDVGISDTAILNPTSVRFAVTAAVLTNTADAARTVEIYESPDQTSASGELVATLVLDALEALPIEEVIGQSYNVGENLVAVASNGSGGDVKARLTYTHYTGSS